MPEKPDKSDKPDTTPFPAAVAALAILSAVRLCDYFADENGNESQRQADGSVRISISQREGGHKRVYVRVPETVDLLVVDALISPE